MDYLVITALLLLSALFSGLNLGLMSLGPHTLKRKKELGDKQAAKVYEIRKNGNLLLVTLLLGNVAVNSILAIYLGSITVGLVAVVASTGLITLFGEIIPQAVFSRHALNLSAKIVWLVRIFIVVLYPICRPISSMLDWALGEELPTIYSRQELVNILEEHSESTDSEIKSHEEQIARGALTYGEKTIQQVMTPRDVVTSLSIDQKITNEFVKHIKESGFARFPVMQKEEVVGTLYTRDLLGVGQGKSMEDIIRSPAIFVKNDQSLDVALKLFLKTKHHLFIVYNKQKRMVGVVSIEDIIEEILGDEIIDEFDQHDEMRKISSPENKT
jgi:metal transporter CNNM